MSDEAKLRQAWLLATLGTVATFLAVNHALVTHQVAPVWDASSQHAPWQMLVADFARSGQLLLWNPWTNGGAPAFANPGFGAFSPLTVGIGAITGGTSYGFITYWLFIWLLGGLSLLCLAHHLRAPPWGAFAVAVGFLFSGFQTGHAEHTAVLYSMAFAPLILWRFDVALLERRWWPAVEAGALWGLSALAGYPGVVMMTAGYAFLWGLGRVLVGWPDHTSSAKAAAAAPRVPSSRAFLGLALLCVIGLVVLAPTYAGFLVEGAGFTDRAGALTREAAIGENALHPRALYTLASPYISSGFHPEIWHYNDVSSRSLYVGPLVLWLALVALVARPRSAWRWWLWGIAALSLAVAMGASFPLRGWLYDLFPPTRFVRHASMFRGLAMLSVAVLALEATRDLHNRSSFGITISRVRLVGSALTLAIAAIWGYVVFATQISPDAASSALSAAHLVVAWGGVVGIAVLFATRGRAVADLVVLALVVCDAFLTIELSSFSVSTTDPGHLSAWTWIDKTRSAALEMASLKRIESVPSRSNHNLPRKLPVLDAYADDRNRFHRRWLTEPVLVSAALGKRRIWFSPRAELVPPGEAAFEAFRERARTEGAFPLLIHDPEELKQQGEKSDAPLHQDVRRAIQTLPHAQPIDVRLISYRPKALEFEVDCRTAGWLLVTDRWAAGWSATVNGEPTPVWGGTFIFRAIRVSQGTNRVRFRYDPFGFPELLIVSWATLAAVAAGSIIAGTGRPRGRTNRSAAGGRTRE